MGLDKEVADIKKSDIKKKRKIRVAGIKEDSVVDGVGIRLVLFTQGCPHHCKGCHNENTHSYDGGREIELSEIIDIFERNTLLDGITFSGGEPFMQVEPLIVLCDYLHERKMNTWCYTGFTYEELIEKSKVCEKTKEFLSKIDVLVDGRFVEEELDLKLKFRGSKNQRVIDLVKTKNSNKLELLFNE